MQRKSALKIASLPGIILTFAVLLGLLTGATSCDPGSLDVINPPNAEIDDELLGLTRLAVGSRSSNLVGLHSPEMDDAAAINRMKSVFGNQTGGWLTTAAYASHFDWLGYEGSGLVGQTIRADEAGFRNVIRVDYAGGTNVPPRGQTTKCPHREGASPATAETSPDGTHLGCYLRYIDTFARRAGGAVNVWIIGNEMNLGTTEAKMFIAQGNALIDPAWYVEVYEAARATIHAIPGHENDLVLVASVSPGKGCAASQYPDCTMSGKDYLDKMLRRLSPDRTDGFSIHAYGGWADPGSNGGISALKRFEDGDHASMGYKEQLRMLDDRGFSQAPVIISEFSAHTHHPVKYAGEVDHTVDFLKKAYEGIHRWNENGGHKILGAVWFTWNQGSFITENLARFEEMQAAFRQIARRKYPGRVPDGTSSQGGSNADNGGNGECNLGALTQNKFKMCIFESTSPLTYVTTEEHDALNFDWGRGGPAGLRDHFQIVAAGLFHFEAGEYVFNVAADDGVRLDVGNNGRREIDEWNIQAVRRFKTDPIRLSGWVPIVVRYFEHDGEAALKLNWERVSGQSGQDDICAIPDIDNCCFVSEMNLNCQTDAQWVDGWHCYHDRCASGGAGATSSEIKDDPSVQNDGPPAFCHEPNKDNCCHFAPKTQGIPATFPGGICDPNGDGNFSDADWTAGWYCYHEACG
ncbi:MAG: PA14 domain-containing protein [Bradymonadaceae bacterium]